MEAVSLTAISSVITEFTSPHQKWLAGRLK